MSNKKAGKKQESFRNNIQAYFKGVKSEWGKVTWPEPKQIISETIIVLVVVAFFTTLVYLLDMAFCFTLHPNDICVQCLKHSRTECSK